MTLYSLCLGVLLNLSWPPEWAWSQTAILLLLLLEAWRNERHLVQRVGYFALEAEGDWLWQGACWQMQRKADWLPFGVLLVLRNQQGQRWRWWLMHDNMPPGEWRTLRAISFMRDAPTPH